MYESVEKQEGKGPVRPTQVATLLDQTLYSAFTELAERNERSVAAELRLAVRRHLEKEKTA